MGADLMGADLTGTCLDPAAPVPALTDEEIKEGGLAVRGEYVWGWRTKNSPYVGKCVYMPRPEPYVAPWFSVDRGSTCHPGIYLSGRAWLEGVHPEAEVVRVYCRRDELLHTGGPCGDTFLTKWRAKRLWVVPEGQETEYPEEVKR
jgi:hypothetical protein